jgi:8-oxo-dGTP pyrophosphatase MutT (NUDIX family)
LFKYNKEKNNNTEILLIKKRYSYHFLSLVMGHYKKNDERYIRHLFDNMSFSEKIDVLGMQFSQMWYRIWLNNPEKYYNIVDVYKSTNFASNPIENKFSNAEIYKLYFQKNRFENNFLKDNGIKLRNILSQSNDAEILWEMPKGGKHTAKNGQPFVQETNIDCAMREFYEETSITSDRYKILYDVQPLIDSFIDNDTIYKTVYYTAVLQIGSENLMPKIDFKNFDQITEIQQIRWASLADIKFFNLTPFVNNRLVNLYTNVIKQFKLYNKLKKII